RPAVRSLSPSVDVPSPPPPARQPHPSGDAGCHWSTRGQDQAPKKADIAQPVRPATACGTSNGSTAHHAARQPSAKFIASAERRSFFENRRVRVLSNGAEVPAHEHPQKGSDSY